MIAIGTDPGTATTGYGVVQKEKNDFFCLEYGIISTNKKDSDPKRLCVLNEKINNIIKKYSPDIFAVENVYFFKNLKTALPVSQSKGVIMMTAQKAEIPVYEFTPLEVKMFITGYGNADKKQMQEMIKLSLNLKKIPRPDDAADALGVAISAIVKHGSYLL